MQQAVSAALANCCFDAQLLQHPVEVLQQRLLPVLLLLIPAAAAASCKSGFPRCFESIQNIPLQESPLFTFQMRRNERLEGLPLQAIRQQPRLLLQLPHLLIYLLLLLLLRPLPPVDPLLLQRRLRCQLLLCKLPHSVGQLVEQFAVDQTSHA
jgi:hypothetical protein